MDGGGTEEFAFYIEKKILSRLATLARFKKVSALLSKSYYKLIHNLFTDRIQTI